MSLMTSRALFSSNLRTQSFPSFKNIRFPCNSGKNLQKSCSYLQPHGEAGGGCPSSAHPCTGVTCCCHRVPKAVPRASSRLLSSPAVFLARARAGSGAQSGLSSPSARSAQSTSRSGDATGQAELVTSLAFPYLTRGSKALIAGV